MDKALERIGISHNERHRIYKILAAILHLGNVEIEDEIGSDKCKISEQSRKHLKCAAILLDIEQEVLEIVLLTRSIDVKGSEPIM